MLLVRVHIQTIATAEAAATAVYPTIGGTETLNDQGFAWAAVDINTEWEPGKKYIYTLHFTENGYGKVDDNQGDGGDPGENDPEPGEDVVDAPVKLILDVEVVDWTEVTEEKNM